MKHIISSSTFGTRLANLHHMMMLLSRLHYLIRALLAGSIISLAACSGAPQPEAIEPPHFGICLERISLEAASDSTVELTGRLALSSSEPQWRVTVTNVTQENATTSATIEPSTDFTLMMPGTPEQHYRLDVEAIDAEGNSLGTFDVVRISRPDSSQPITIDGKYCPIE